jgi:hypothetical protein
MAIAFLRGTITREPYFQNGEQTAFAACSIKESYRDRTGEERIGGYHDVIAFGDDAQRLALMTPGTELEVKASIRYRADKRYISTDNPDKNPFLAQFVVMEFLSSKPGNGSVSREEDPFA